MVTQQQTQVQPMNLRSGTIDRLPATGSCTETLARLVRPREVGSPVRLHRSPSSAPPLRSAQGLAMDERIAARGDWKTEPLPDRRATLEGAALPAISLSQDEFARA